MIAALQLSLFPAFMIYAACSDLLTMTISNRVALLLAAGFAVMAWLTGMTATESLSHVAAGFAVLVVAFILFARGWIGGGDAKFAAAIALWLGFAQLAAFLIVAAILGGFLTLALLQMRSLPLPAALAGQQWLQRLHMPASGIPYGIALASAGLLLYPHSIWMRLSGL